MNTTTEQGIPVLIDHYGKGGWKFGRGRAGWTVITVETSKVADFLRALPRESWMPGTFRLAQRFGVTP